VYDANTLCSFRFSYRYATFLSRKQLQQKITLVSNHLPAVSHSIDNTRRFERTITCYNTITIDSLPIELIGVICEHLAPADIPNFRNTSRKLHEKVLQLNENCNRMVGLRYPMEATFFLTTLRNGWLVPSHNAFTVHDNNSLGLNTNTKLTKIH